jgi:hypothetical protein
MGYWNKEFDWRAQKMWRLTCNVTQKLSLKFFDATCSWVDT